MDPLNRFTYLKSANADYIDELFGTFLKDPDRVDPTWRYFFEGLELGAEAPLQPEKPANGAAPQAPSAAATPDMSAEAKVAELITAYRELGRLLADINPLAPPSSSHPLLELSRFGLTQADLDRKFTAGKLLGMGPAKLSQILERLRETYCRTIGVEFTHIQDPDERKWLESRMELSRNREDLTPEDRQFILRRLVESETFERFLHTRYVAQKRFSIEGGESVIPALDRLIEVGAELGAKEFVLGMAHRGRLNVLCNVFGKKPELIFTEFEGHYQADTSLGEGDVKYHMGYSTDFTTRLGKTIHLSLGSNPSHLEVIDPVVEGVARAKQCQRSDAERTQVIPILIHGDASFAGQGVVYETLNLSQLDGYATGGTVHVVINNQVGFTTSPCDSRSTTYCTDVAKMLETPIFHVNGDDPEAVWYVALVCMEYRQKFRKDVFIDLVCYRKHGHNESDEPTFTQPLLYKEIKSHSSTRELYSRKLVSESVLSADQAEQLIDRLNAQYTEFQAKTRAENPRPYVSTLANSVWQKYRRPGTEDLWKPVPTAVDEVTLRGLADKLNGAPQGFQVHPKLTRFLAARLKAVQEGRGIDWGNGEALAYASLLNEGHPVRLSGQDAERGTFSHRNSVLNDYETGERYIPLNQLREGQAPFHVYNSHLSEMAVMGFEYGYSLADPDTLVIWEAQFGDFANGAQIMVDQFISSSESKWQRMSGLVLFLPHGFEGQGPEHSSARLERFLQLCGRDNMTVCNFTTPAQLFHGIRRQVKRDFRKPMIVMTPKSLLRHPHAISDLSELTSGAFQEVLDDSGMGADPGSVSRVLLCSGKVHYDLHAERIARKHAHAAIVRVEQLYPWPADALAGILERYRNAKQLIWVQEEPRNMGAWTYVHELWSGGTGLFQEQAGGRPIRYVGREIGAAPAVGSAKIHDKEQRALIEKAFYEA